MKEELLRRLQNEVLISADAYEILLKSDIDEATLENIIKYVKENNILIVDSKVIEIFLDKKIKKEEKKIEVKNKNNKNILSYIKTSKTIEDNKKIRIEEKTVIEIKKEIIEKNERYIGEEIETKVKEIKKSKLPIVNIKKFFNIQKNKPDINSWVNYYKKRLKKLKEVLREHLELKNIKPINMLRQDEEAAIVGLIYDKRIKDNGVVYIIEDGTKDIKVFVSQEIIKENPLYRDIPLDSVVGFIGELKGNIFIAKKVILPDIPIKNREYAEEDIYILFTGDWQIGNRHVIEGVINNFIKFINAKTGNSKLDSLAKKIGYIAIVGDIVDGVGIYPNQEQELIHKTIEKQYEEVEKLLLKIPDSIKVILIPGNHDIPRLAEPQPPFPSFLFKEVYNKDNIYFLSNPSYVEIHEKFKLLIYHGYVLDWFVSELPFIREQGGYRRPEVIMQLQLMLRHLAPTHGSTPYVPYLDEDPLIIEDVPDFFHTGHIHMASYSTYKGVDLINSSTFQDITPYQIELGHEPLPGIVYLRNLKNSEVLAIDLKSLGMYKLRNEL